MKLTHRPLVDRQWMRPADERERSRFTATWSAGGSAEAFQRVQDAAAVLEACP